VTQKPSFNFQANLNQGKRHRRQPRPADVSARLRGTNKHRALSEIPVRKPEQREEKSMSMTLYTIEKGTLMKAEKLLLC
jgi:hypothetical protein